MTTINLEETPATMADIVNLVSVLTIEMMGHSAFSATGYDESLIDMANKIQEMSKQTTNVRARVLLGAFAERLIGTEDGGI